jgi:DNA polymerase-3 subunit alpha
MFHNHHSHSYYSLLDGFSSPEELLKRAEEIGMGAISITDHGTLSGHRDLLVAAKKSSVKPILGLEAYFTTDRLDKRARKDRADEEQIYNHLIVLAQNENGLQNLSKLSEIGWNDGFFSKPRIDFEVLQENSKDLIVLSGCMNSIIAKAIQNGNMDAAKRHTDWFKQVFKDNFYMELQPHNPAELNLQMLKLADDMGVKSTVTLDCHYASPEDKIAEEIMLILGTHPKVLKESTFDDSRKIKDVIERLDYLYGDRFMSFKDLDIFLMDYKTVRDKMIDQGIDRDDLYENSMEISSKVGSYDLKENLDLLPVDHKDPNSELERLAMEGLIKRGFGEDKVYLDRLKEELEIIKSKNFSSYFLVVSDMIGWSKSNNIFVGPGRGSAAGSLVCYALEITEVDPIKYGLLFFRFINPERNDFPDIDTDYEDRKRGQVKDYLAEQYKHVASIATFLTFKDKGVVRDVARVFHIPLPEVNKALKGVETWDDFITDRSTAEFRQKYPEVVKYASRLRGRIRGTGMHAAGIVAAKDSISKYAPMETRKDTQSDDRVQVVAVDMEQAADIGLIKIDALGLKTLTVIHDAIDMIEERQGVKLNLRKIDLTDREVYADLTAGFTKGVFQAETTPYTNLLVKMGVYNFDELAASNALVRPGAMNTIGAEYIARKKGKKPVKYLHDIVKDFTQDTYGCILYQEQVMLACVHLGGMSMAEADKVRKIIGKKKDAKEFDKFKDQFVKGASKHITEKQAESLWHDFEAHAGYSFNKSHAVAYSMLSYWSAWIKRYYPHEFMYSLLKNEKDKDTRTDYLIEAKRMGIKIRLPHINESDLDFTLEEKAIRFGLGNIKYISENIGKKIIDQRPFYSYAEFMEHATKKGSGINSRAIDALNRVGAAAFNDNQRTGEENKNFYEYLNIPEFHTDIPRWIEAYTRPIEEYEEEGCFLIIGMVKSIKRGDGWSRIEVVDKTGSVGVFDRSETTIEPGKMYIFLIADNRIGAFATPEDLKDTSNPFVKYLMSRTLSLAEGEYMVISFTPRKTKKGDKMANVVLADDDKELYSVVAFPTAYAESLVKMKPGGVCKPVLNETSSGSIAVKGFERV